MEAIKYVGNFELVYKFWKDVIMQEQRNAKQFFIILQNIEENCSNTKI